MFIFFFFFNDTATTEIYTLSLHDALPIWSGSRQYNQWLIKLAKWLNIDQNTVFWGRVSASKKRQLMTEAHVLLRSEEHTSELQSPCNLVCRLLLEKKKSRQAIVSRTCASR